MNADPDKYVYIGYDIGFNTRIEFSLPDGSVGNFTGWYELISAYW